MYKYNTICIHVFIYVHLYLSYIKVSFYFPREFRMAEREYRQREKNEEKFKNFPHNAKEKKK